MSDKKDKDYLDKPQKPSNNDEEVEETMIYDGDTLKEKQKKKEDYQKNQLNE